MTEQDTTVALTDLPKVSDRLTFAGTVPDAESIVQITTGAGLTLVNRKMVELTRGVARVVLELPEFVVDGQLVDRNLRDSHVTYLLSAMKRGTFHPEWVQIITCVCREPINTGRVILPAGTKYRMNGQHTCWAREYMDADWPCRVSVLEYEAATVADMRQLYASIDRGAARQNGDVLISLLAGTDQFRDVSRRTLKALAAGLAVWLAPVRATQKRDATELAQLLQTQYATLALKVAAFIKDGSMVDSREVLTRAAVVGAMYATFDVAPVRAAEFWDAVRTGLNFQSLYDPRKKLREALATATVVSVSGGNRGGAGDVKRVTSEEMYRWCVHCWNAWRRGEELKRITIKPDSRRPTAK